MNEDIKLYYNAEMLSRTTRLEAMFNPDCKLKMEKIMKIGVYLREFLTYTV
jgi:hypothetical protein